MERCEVGVATYRLDGAGLAFYRATSVGDGHAGDRSRFNTNIPPGDAHPRRSHQRFYPFLPNISLAAATPVTVGATTSGVTSMMS